MAPAPARSCAWALLVGLLWLSRAGAARRVDGAEAILAEGCRGDLLLAGRPPHEDITRGLAGIFIRGRCSPPEAALWYGDTGRAYWANPYAAARGLAEDIRRVLADTPAYRDLAIQVLESAFGPPHEVRAPLPPPPPGCVLPPRYHAAGPCVPGDGLYR
ncbi:envelope glycoprotein L [Cervid alphaherpesvirus 3]|uniref:Envelope glycoprotein L n=1 Tax=Cervid alphaherpesvirus 3 TaxID=2115790 RepID=A0A455JN25_9ALPH|nr:envelope glycoprotein L [Cervid alphaherpesvirus 3]AVT50644.1 envelope glycoprotein L [Cervid alphaherpesvirus 3]